MNGVEDLEKLNVYIKDDIERYGTKLEDCHRRLKRFYAELLVRDHTMTLMLAACLPRRRRWHQYIQ